MRWRITGVLLFLSGLLAGQPMRFSHLDQKQGLSQNTATAFLQDRDGFVWVGTQDGLNQYDGYSFKVFRTVANDTNSLTDNFILALTEDSGGNIWVGTRNGLCVFSKRTGKFYRYYSPWEDAQGFHMAIRKVIARRDSGIIYRDTKGMLLNLNFSLRGKSGEFSADHIADKVQEFSYCRSSDRIAYLSQGFIRFCNSRGQPDHLMYEWHPIARMQPILTLEEHALYVSDSTEILTYSCDSVSGPHFYFHCDVPINCMMIDTGKTIWLGTTDGLRIIPGESTGTYAITVQEDQSDYFSLTGKRVESIYRSPQNLVLIGTVGAVNIFDPQQNVFRHLYGTFPAIDDSPIWFISTFDKSVLWASDESYTYIADESNQKWINKIPRDLHYTAGCFDSKGNFWMGTRNDGLIIIDTSTGFIDKRFLHAETFLNCTIMDLCSTTNGKMWIAAIGCLAVIDEHTFDIQVITHRLKAQRQIRGSYFTSLAPDHDGNVYVGAANGLFRFTSDSTYTQFVNDPADPQSLAWNIINDVEYDGRFVWIGTMGYGLDRFDPATKMFTHFTTSEGLANNTIYGIESDQQHRLWLSSNEGLIAFNPSTGTSFNYTMRDGLPTNEFVINRHAHDEQGNLYFGSSQGLIAFDPRQLAYHDQGSTPVISQLLVNFRERFPGSDSMLLLAPDERNITFEFTAMNFRVQDKIRYEYRLLGFDSTWRAAPAGNRTAVYTNLPYGKYTFQVRYRISGEAWSDNVLSRSITIETPFYATTWFLVLVMLGGLFLVASVVRYISQRNLRRQLIQLKLKEEIRNEKERISRDLHDTVGAQLTYVISSLDNMSYNLNRGGPGSAFSEKADQLSTFARGTMDQLRESIWAINSEQISLSELMSRWKLFVAQMTESNPGLNITVTRTGDDYIFKPTIAIEVHRIIQEAINNAVKHSNGNQIEVHISNSGDHLRITVHDNGTGFNANEEKAGHYGMSNMKERVKIIGARLEITSSSTGTVITLELSPN